MSANFCFIIPGQRTEIVLSVHVRAKGQARCREKRAYHGTCQWRMLTEPRMDKTVKLYRVAPEKMADIVSINLVT